MSNGSDSVGGYFGELGWPEAEDRGSFGRTLQSAALVAVSGAYWAGIWLTSGLAPLCYVAGAAGTQSLVATARQPRSERWRRS